MGTLNLVQKWLLALNVGLLLNISSLAQNYRLKTQKIVASSDIGIGDATSGIIINNVLLILEHHLTQPPSRNQRFREEAHLDSF